MVSPRNHGRPRPPWLPPLVALDALPSATPFYPVQFVFLALFLLSSTPGTLGLFPRSGRYRFASAPLLSVPAVWLGAVQSKDNLCATVPQVDVVMVFVHSEVSPCVRRCSCASSALPHCFGCASGARYQEVQEYQY